MWVGDFEAEITQHAEGLRAGDLMDEMGVNEELGLSVVQRAYLVCVPNFFKKCFAHGRLFACDVSLFWIGCRVSKGLQVEI